MGAKSGTKEGGGQKKRPSKGEQGLRIKRLVGFGGEKSKKKKR